MQKNLVIRLYFPLDAVHVSDSVSPTSGAIFYKPYIAFGICQYVWLLCGCRKDFNSAPVGNQLS